MFTRTLIATTAIAWAATAAAAGEATPDHPMAFASKLSRAVEGSGPGMGSGLAYCQPQGNQG